MDQARACTGLPVIIPSLSLSGTGAGPSEPYTLQESPASSTSHTGGQDSSATDSDAFLQAGDASARRHLPSPDLPRLSPSWNSSSASSSYTTRKSEQSQSPWHSYPSNTFPSLPNPYAHPWNGEPQFDSDSSRSKDTGNSKVMQAEAHQQYMLPIMSPTAGLTYAPAPPTFGGGLGAAFPEYLPSYPYNPFNSSAQNIEPLPSEIPYQPPPRDSERGQVGPTEYTQALDIYRHIRAALPHIRAADAPGPTGAGQSYRSILDVASTAVGVLSGLPQKPTTAPTKISRAPVSAPEPKRARVTNGDKEKPATFCRGCGATETPEWRRGPLGPRTLCNACGLVHMKMMRKKRKAEEKAAADAAK